MKVAVFYDIHGNLPALEAVLEEVLDENVDRIVVGGDVVPGPMPSETLTRLKELDLPIDYILGNGDREVLARMMGEETDWYNSSPQPRKDSIDWNAAQLNSDDKDLMGGWPSTFELEIDELGIVLFCHATPRSDIDCFTRLTDEEKLIPVFDNVNSNIVICGHTHMQFERKIGQLKLINAGSIGMPFGTRSAEWLMLGPDIQLRQTDYDIDAASKTIRETKGPGAEETATGLIDPPSSKVMLELFSKFELALRATQPES